MVNLDQYIEIQELARLGMSKTEIGHRVGVDRHTVAKYLKTLSPPAYKRCRGRPRIMEEFKDYLKTRIAQGCTNGIVLLREIQAKGYKGGYETLKKYIRPLREDFTCRVELRWESQPGQHAQVDWGYFQAQLSDRSMMKLYAFVFTLAYSRAMYVEWTNSMDMATFERCHENAFAYLGGVPRFITYDRVKTVVLGEDEHSEIRFHPAFTDFAEYYGFIPRVCPRRWPKGKGKVESGVKYVRRNFWAGLISISGIDDLNWRCRDWLAKVANMRIHGTTGRVPLEMLREENLPSTAGRPAYPVEPAVLRRVSHDCLVSFRGCRYSVPSDWANKNVWVRAVSGQRLVVSAGGQIISEHPLEPVLKRTVLIDSHYAKLRHRSRMMPAKPIPRVEQAAVEVKHRSLSEYESLLEVGV